jgi:hypothetical protein
MYEYEIAFTDLVGREHLQKLDAVGLAEAVDTFIETYCPVSSIESVYRVTAHKPDNRESRPA